MLKLYIIGKTLIKKKAKENKGMTVEDIEIIERDNNIPPEKSILAKEDLHRIRKDFITVKGCFPGTGEEEVEVPTKEEYDDFRQRVGKCLDRLESRLNSIVCLLSK